MTTKPKSLENHSQRVPMDRGNHHDGQRGVTDYQPQQ